MPYSDYEQINGVKQCFCCGCGREFPLPEAIKKPLMRTGGSYKMSCWCSEECYDKAKQKVPALALSKARLDKRGKT